jgi:hypothetical protein
LNYTVARLAILVVTYVVLWALASRRWDVHTIDPFVLMASIIVSAVISLFVLRTMREELAGKLQQRADRAASRVDASRDVDDVD